MRLVGLSVLPLALTGCSSLKGGDNLPPIPVTVSEVSRAIICDFSYAIQRTGGEGSPLGTWGAFIEVKLGVKNSANVIPGLGTLNAKAGNASLTLKPSNLTIDDSVQDKNHLAYFMPLEGGESHSSCPKDGAPDAASGLGLADFLVGTVEIIRAGGKLQSTSSSSDCLEPDAARLKALSADVSVAGSTPTLAATKEDIPTICYNGSFAISHTVGGGLTFQVADVSMSVLGSGATHARAAADNIITIAMGDMVPDTAGDNSLVESIWKRRTQDVEVNNALRPNNVIIINPPPP